jgi:hypothetical protein
MTVGCNEQGNIPYISNEHGHFLTSCLTVSYSMTLLLHYSKYVWGAGRSFLSTNCKQHIFHEEYASDNTTNKIKFPRSDVPLTLNWC